MKAFQKLSTSTLRALKSAEVIQREDILVFRLKGGIPHSQVLSFLNELKSVIQLAHPELDGVNRILDMWKETERPPYPTHTVAGVEQPIKFDDLTEEQKKNLRDNTVYKVYAQVKKPKVITNVDRERLVPKKGLSKIEYSRTPPINKANTYGADFENTIRPLSSFNHLEDNEGKGKYLAKLATRREEARLLATRKPVVVEQQFKMAA